MERNWDVLDSEMAGQIKLKLDGMVEGLWQNILMKKIFNPSKLIRVRSGME